MRSENNLLGTTTRSALNSKKKGVLTDRADALNKLVEIMPIKEMQKLNYVVIAVSLGGVYFANQFSKIIGAPFDFLFTEPITAPNNPECQIGMVSETEEIVIHENLIKSFDINLDFIYGEATRKYEEKILKYIYKYRKGEMIRSLAGKHILLADEGIDSGLTMIAAVKTVITLGAKSVSFAVPVMPYDVAQRLDEIIDEIYCLHKPQDFVDVPYYYQKIEEIRPSDIEGLIKENIQRQKKESNG